MVDEPTCGGVEGGRWLHRLHSVVEAVESVDRRWRAAAAAAFALLVAAASVAQPPSTGSPAGMVFYGVPYGDLLLHLTGYFVLSLLVVYALGDSPGDDGFGVETTLAAVAVFGFALEVVQAGVPLRSLSVADAVANSMGVAVAYLWLRRWWR